MRQGALSLLSGMMLLYLAGCSRMQGNAPSDEPSSMTTAPVSLTMTDEPPNGVTVLFFQVSITNASLAPASGSTNVPLLSNSTPIQVDVTQLQALSAFLSTANVPAGSYESLSLTFADPQLVILNTSDEALAGTCALNTVCQLTPQIDYSSTLTFSSTPFPVTVAQNTPLGFLLDFHLNDVIQQDLSVNLGVSNGVAVTELPLTPPSLPPQFGFLTGAVQSVNASQNQFVLETGDGRTFTIDSNSSTTYDDFPSSVCSSGSISCLTPGQIVQVEVGTVQANGALLAAQVSYLQAAKQQTAEGEIVSVSASNGNTVMMLILHQDPSNASGLPLGGKADVTVESSAAFSIDSNGFTIPAGLSFTSASDLLVGQEVKVDVIPGSLSTASNPGNPGIWGPPRSLSLTTDSVELEPSQITGAIAAINSTGSSFTLSSYPNFFFAPSSSLNPNPAQIDVETTGQTTYPGLSSDSFSGLAVHSMVSVDGWLLPPLSGTTLPTLVAETVVVRPNGFF